MPTVRSLSTIAELSVARRLHRGGEGQYLVNRAAVRRLDLVELLADLGLGQGMHSIISQGKVEAILASRPAERRALIEEAAGLGRFKARRHRAELKLARVAIEVERARDVEAEVKKRLRPLALQATAAERAQKLAVEIGRLRARIAQLDLAGLEERLAELETRRSAAARRAARGGGETRGAPRRAREGRRGARRRGGRARAGAASALPAAQRGRTSRAAPRVRGSACGPAPGRACSAAPRARRAVRAERAALADEIRLPEERLRALDRALAEREGLPPAARALAEDGERIAFSLLEVEPGRERAVAAALGLGLRRGARRRGGRARAARARAGRRPRQPRRPRRPRPARAGRRMPVVAKEELLASPVAAVTPEGFGYDPERGELWFAGETAEALLLELQARRRRSRRSSTSSARGSTRRSRTPPTPSSGIRLPSGLSGSPSDSSRARGLGRALRGPAPNRRGRRCRTQRRAGRGAPPARSGRGRVAAGAGRRRRRRVEHRGRGRADRGGGRRGAPPVRTCRCGRAGRGRRPRAAPGDGRAARAPSRDARPGQPARARGIRGREGTPRGARRPAGRPRGEPRRSSRSSATSSPRRSSAVSPRRSTPSSATSPT